MLRKTKNEKGAIVVEATLSLTVYIILIFMILSIIDMANTQAKLKVTMNNIAKEMSQFAYAYHAAGLDEAEKNLLKGNEKVDSSIENIEGAFNSVKDSLDSAKSGDIEGANKSGKEAGQQFKDAWGDVSLGDGAAWLLGHASNWGKEEIITKYARSYMMNNLKDFREDSLDAFVKRHHILTSGDIFDFKGSRFVEKGLGTDIILKMKYEIELFDFFDLNFKVKINETAQTKAWLGGIPVKGN
ncbi:hypothetical protein ACKA01_03085 [Helcococcus kunzii]|uniref:hypothetical protein n=1 Tax=Helcococcus kunzii TaxID=40091 RepID=UPI0038A44F47